MNAQPIATVSRELPLELQRQILRCVVTAARDAGATNIATSITASDLVVDGNVSH
jgi:hypothetical protein